MVVVFRWWCFGDVLVLVFLCFLRWCSGLLFVFGCWCFLAMVSAGGGGVLVMFWRWFSVLVYAQAVTVRVPLQESFAKG